MKIILIFFILVFPVKVFSNETEVIELHGNQTLDQIVLDQVNTEINSESKEKNITISEDLSENNQIQLDIINDDDVVEAVNIKSEEIFFDKISPTQFNQILNNANNIKSDSLQSEFKNFLLSLNFDNTDINNRAKFNTMVKYFYNIGDISKSYSLIKTKNLEGDENINFYNVLEINYYLSTSQLDNVCSFKNKLVSEINLQNNFIDKIEIFCLILEDKKSEAQLLNSIMLETEEQIDKNFQQLFSILLNEKTNETYSQELSFDNYDADLIFLYSAMARIGEIPLNEAFLNIDPLNLAIPIILNKSTPIHLRLKAANKSYINGTISRESLAALYQSVDFDSFELNNSGETIIKLNNEIELLMAFHFQFINIQIFPSERLEAIINFWNFAKKNKLENIAYSLTETILNSLEIKADYVNYSPQIAMSYINNNNLNKAIDWITFYQKVNGVDDINTLVNIIINFHSSNDLNTIIDTMNNNYEDLRRYSGENSEELFFILSKILLKNKTHYLPESFEEIYDERKTTSLHITENIEQAINNNNQNKFLIYSIISLNNKDWDEIHPSHLKLLLKGFLEYKNGILIKDIILEIFKNYQLIK